VIYKAHFKAFCVQALQEVRVKLSAKFELEVSAGVSVGIRYPTGKTIYHRFDPHSYK